MLKKITAILCALIVPVSIAFADVASVSADLDNSISNADALQNEIAALEAEGLSSEDALTQATANLVGALIRAGGDPDVAGDAAVAAGGSSSAATAAVTRATQAADAGGSNAAVAGAAASASSGNGGGGGGGGYGAGYG
jgi:hypothetical protein